MSVSAGRTWLIGCGNMGGAMLRRWVASGYDTSKLTVIDPFVTDIPSGVTLLREVPPPDPDGAVDTIVLAVKPQQIFELPKELLSQSRAWLAISVIAGVELSVIDEIVDAEFAIRAMPNLPASIGKGAVALHSPWVAESGVKAATESLMAPLGLVEWIEREELFHAVTALSGSGPGFVYRFIEALAEAGTALGLPADQAERFAIATVEGAAALADGAGETPAMLAERVASPGGTTRAGLDVLDHDNALKRLVHETLTAAARRSAELAAAARD